MLGVFCTTRNLECLPFSGGWADQPLWITRSLEILVTEKAQADEEEREKKREEAERVRKHGKR